MKRAASLRLAPATQKSRTLRLCHIQHWHRHGGEPTIYDEPLTDSHYVRVTIDSSGIEGISLITAQDEAYETAPTSSRLFILQKPATLGGVMVHFEAGYCRFDFLYPTSITLLNCPLLPKTYCEVVQASTKSAAAPDQQKAMLIQPFGRLSFIDTALCFGLTFFLYNHRIAAVHSHTPLAPTAYDTFLCISPGCRQSAIWLYLPLPIGDEITALGGSAIATGNTNAMNSKCLFVKTKHQGLVQLGQFNDGRASVQLTKTVSRPLLAHDVTSGLIYLLTESLGATSHHLPAKESLLNGAYVAQAQLKGVTAAHTFMERRTRHCRGILFQYDNRTVSVGQCRLGVDEVKSVQHPVRVRCLTNEHILTVGFAAGNAHSHTSTAANAEWICHDMRGTLEFCFSQASAKVRIAQQPHAP